MNPQELNKAAHAAWEDGDEAQAEQLFIEALAQSPQDARLHFDLALLYKFQSRWSEALQHNLRALELDASDDAAWWNLGIAATAVRNWPEAARAWAHFGQTLPLDMDPPAMPPEEVAIRVRHGNMQDIVWGVRLDPARALITGVPLPDCGIGHGDILLLDGVPRGARQKDGKDYPVYEVIERWQQGTLATYVLEVEVSQCEQQDTLFSLAKKAGLPVADLDFNEASTSPKWLVVRQYGIAAQEDEPVAALLEAWQAACPDVLVRDIFLAYPEEDEA